MIYGRQLTRSLRRKKGFGIFSALPNAILTFPIFVRLHLVNLGARSVVSIGTNYSGLRTEPGGLTLKHLFHHYSRSIANAPFTVPFCYGSTLPKSKTGGEPWMHVQSHGGHPPFSDRKNEMPRPRVSRDDSDDIWYV